MSLNKGHGRIQRRLWGVIVGLSFATLGQATTLASPDLPVLTLDYADTLDVDVVSDVLNDGATELTVNVVDPDIIGEAVRTADPTIADKLTQALSNLKWSLALNVLANAYAIYELDTGNFAHTYAQKNYEAAKATGLIVRSMASLGYAISAYAFELSTVVPALVPFAIFTGIGLSIEYGLSKRYEKMKVTEQTHLFFHQLYYKYFVEYARHKPFAQLNDLTGVPTLVMVKDADLLAQTIDLSDDQVHIQQVGTLHLAQMDQRNRLTNRLVNVREHWLKHGKNLGDDSNQAQPFRHIYRQMHVPESGASTPSVQQNIDSDEVMAVLLPAQPKYILPWKRQVLTTKKGGVYAKNFQLGASLGLSLERTLFTHFKPYFFMEENRHLTQLYHDKQQVYDKTLVQVVLPPRALELLLLVEPWMASTLETLYYRLQAADAADQYYSFNSDFFHDWAGTADKSQPRAKKLQMALAGGRRDTFWVMHLRGIDFDGGAVVRQGDGKVVVEAKGRQLMVDIQGTTGHLLIHGVTKGGGSTRYVQLQGGEIKSNTLAAATLDRYLKLKAAYVAAIAKRIADKQADTNNPRPPRARPPTSLFLSNATWEVGTATLQFNDGTTTEVTLPAEDTTEVTLHRDINTLDKMTFKTTKSVRDKANPTRTIDKNMLLNYLVEEGTMLCFRLDQGQLARDFKVTPNLCAANIPSYQIGTAPIDPTLPDDKKILYKMEHLRPDAPDKPVRYHKLVLDNQTRETLYVSLRYRYAGQVYRLVVDEVLTPWQKVRYLGGTLGSRAEYHVPAGAEILSLRVVYDTKSGWYDFFELDPAHPDGYQTTHDDAVAVLRVMNASRYFDLTKGLLHAGRLKEVSLWAQQKRYRDSYDMDHRQYNHSLYMIH